MEPHAVLSKIGRYAHDGVSQLEKTLINIYRIQACVNDALDPPFNPDIVSRENKTLELDQAVCNVMLEDAELDFKSDQEVKSLLMNMQRPRILSLSNQLLKITPFLLKSNISTGQK